MPLLSGSSPARSAARWAFVLHTLAALWLWLRWGQGVRGGVLFWMDLPLSFVWAGATGGRLLATTLLLGGAWWALLAAGLTTAIGRITRGR